MLLAIRSEPIRFRDRGSRAPTPPLKAIALSSTTINDKIYFCLTLFCQNQRIVYNNISNLVLLQLEYNIYNIYTVLQFNEKKKPCLEFGFFSSKQSSSFDLTFVQLLRNFHEHQLIPRYTKPRERQSERPRPVLLQRYQVPQPNQYPTYSIFSWKKNVEYIHENWTTRTVLFLFFIMLFTEEVSIKLFAFITKPL